jgi:hypothetical protein
MLKELATESTEVTELPSEFKRQTLNVKSFHYY